MVERHTAIHIILPHINFTTANLTVAFSGPLHFSCQLTLLLGQKSISHQFPLSSNPYPLLIFILIKEN